MNRRKNLILSILNVKKMFFGSHRCKQNTEMLSFDDMMANIITKNILNKHILKIQGDFSIFMWVLGSSFGLHRLLLWPHLFVDERKPIY